MEPNKESITEEGSQPSYLNALAKSDPPEIENEEKV